MFEELLRKLRPEIKDVAREVQYLNSKLNEFEKRLELLESRGLTLHDAETPIQLSAWTCAECSQVNNGLDEICQHCRTPKAS